MDFSRFYHETVVAWYSGNEVDAANVDVSSLILPSLPFSLIFHPRLNRVNPPEKFFPIFINSRSDRNVPPIRTFPSNLLLRNRDKSGAEHRFFSIPFRCRNEKCPESAQDIGDISQVFGGRDRSARCEILSYLVVMPGGFKPENLRFSLPLSSKPCLSLSPPPLLFASLALDGSFA